MALRQGKISTGELAASWLVAIGGPEIAPIRLEPKPAGVTIGRHEQCDVCLPSDAEKVSRSHARFINDVGNWRVADLNSRWGTYVNGRRVEGGKEMPLREGDLIRIAPWTFTLSPTAQRRGLATSDDSGMTMIRSVGPTDSARGLADEMLSLLLESAAAIHAAGDEHSLAEVMMESAVRGTGLQNAAVLRPIDAAGHVEIMSSKLANPTAQSNAPMTYSRSLLAAASGGTVAEISGGVGGDISASIVQMKIAAAICVPLMLGPAAAAYLYLDSRGNMVQTLRPNASAFCVALGRMASLALSNLKRIEMEGREQIMRSELAAAATAQKWILPQRHCSCGGFACVGDSKPGQYVGGDFFDIVELSPTKAAVALGDVSGKGISASVLMTATQGFLHASLLAHGDVKRAVDEVNKFVNPRRPDNKFVTMWVGVFDREAKTVSYVDAGHSYATLQRVDGSFEQLDQGGGMPVGLDDGTITGGYEAVTVPFNPGDRLTIVSDGIIEQYGLVQRADGTMGREQFEVAGVQKAMASGATDLIAELFAAVVNHAGTDQLSDDATAVVVGENKP